MVNKKDFKTAEIEDLLQRAGYPWGLEAKDITLFRAAIPLLIMLMTFFLFTLSISYHAINQIDVIDGIAIKKYPAPEIPLLIAVIGAILGYYAPYLLLKIIASSREKHVIAEQKLFSEILFISLKANLTIREAIEEANKTTNYLKPYIIKCLNEWHADRTRALNNLRKEVGIPSFQIIVDLLVQAIKVGDENIHKFLEENALLEEELVNLEITTKSKLRPIIGTLQMILPFILMMAALFYPLVEYMQDLFRLF